MEFDNTLEVPLPPAEAWKLLLDIERVAGCIPGAELTEVVDERTYKGRVAVRIGPVALSLVGQAQLEEVDHDKREALLKAQGADPKGRGSTDTRIRFRVEPEGAGARVLIHSEVKLAGAIAQYGRGSGMIESVAAQLINEFGKALRAEIAQPAGGEATARAAKPISGLKVLTQAAWDSISGKPPREPR